MQNAKARFEELVHIASRHPVEIATPDGVLALIALQSKQFNQVGVSIWVCCRILTLTTVQR
jgi:hypothetical protein